VRAPLGSVCLLALGLASCQAYQPATEVICEDACTQRLTCEPDAFWSQFTHEGECRLACENDWLSARRDETSGCEQAWKRAFTCVAALSCEQLAEWRTGDPHTDPGLPCARQSLEAELSCTYQCVYAQDCRGWEVCSSGTCVARACETADDCPAGVWCTDGSCSPI